MRKFYTEVSVIGAEGAYEITLDGRTVKTPGKEALLMPTEALANAVAVEWRAQGDKIDTESMPITRLANTALDRVKPRFELVASEIAEFGNTDLVCYRANDPEEIIKKQSDAWDPYLKWAEEALGAKLRTTDGIIHVPQDQASLAKLAAEVDACDPFELTALHEFTNGFGSLVLALAYLKGFRSFEECWTASIVDQIHQEERWGEDSEVTEKTEFLHRDLLAACEFISHLRNKTSSKQA